MDVDVVSLNERGSWDNQEWCDWQEEGHGGVDALGQGKAWGKGGKKGNGKGKGFSGECYNCGIVGHFAHSDQGVRAKEKG